MSDIERELELELHRALDPIASMPIPPRRAVVRARGARGKLLGGAGAAVGFKILTGVAVAAAAVTVAGAATTGSLNPAVWGQQVSQQVENCKDDLTQGQHGIGACVSGFASNKQHGQAVASAARLNGNGNSNNNGNNGNHGNGNNGGGNGSGNSHKPTANPTDEPRDPSSHAAPKVSPGP
ncbi:MAG TPA: hypothetical protein VFL27_09120 [Candidatus Dormibacteraeota bacterium]|nr:hypothetical protein [Candidatus Dormibacteraeota bacterium]